MISVEDREQIRRGYFIDQKSVRQIAKDLHVSRKTVRKAIASAEPADMFGSESFLQEKLATLSKQSAIDAIP